MKKFIFAISFLLLSATSFASPPVYGPLQAQNNLDDVDSESASLLNLGGATLGANSDITSLSGLTTPLSQPQGGIGTTSLGAASVTASGTSTPISLGTAIAGGIDIRTEGALENGVHNDAPAINAAITLGASSGRAVLIYNLGSSIIVDSPIIPVSHTNIVCIGNPTIELANGENTAVIQSSQYTIQGSTGDDYITIVGCTINGNSSNQTASGNIDAQNGISIYGLGTKIYDDYVASNYGNGIVLNGEASAPYPGVPGGVTYPEDTVENLKIYTSGHRSLWVQSGAHDIHISNVIGVDASQLTNDQNCSLEMEGSGRVFNFHGWHTSAATNRVLYQGCFESTGIQVVASSFEGGNEQVLASGGADQFVDNEIYNNFGPSGNALFNLTSNGNTIVGNWFDNGGGTNPAYGVNFGSSASANQLSADYYTNLTTYGPFNFTSDGGLNIINDQGFMGTGGATSFGGTINSSDVISYYQGGSVINYHTIGSTTQSAVSGSTVSLTSGTSANLTSITLQPGTYNISASCAFSAAGSTTASTYYCGASTTSATLPSATSSFANLQGSFPAGAATQYINTSASPFTITSANTVVYLVGQASFGTSTMTGGGKIQATRIYQ